MTHPFAAEAPDATNVWVSTGLDRQVTPEGAISASNRHVWLLVTDTEVLALSTPAFRDWLDSNFPPPGIAQPEVAVYVVAAGRPWVATPTRVQIVHTAFSNEHEIRVHGSIPGRGLTYISFTQFAYRE